MKKIAKSKQDSVVPIEVLAEEIKAISRGVRKLLGGPLNRKTILLLIQSSTKTINGHKLSMSQIEAVLSGAESLEKDHLKQPKDPGKER